jgi:2-oxoglutarate ferredoxin oxidoreductase subunit alpha
MMAETAAGRQNESKMGKVLMKGNEAIGEAAIRAGCLNYFAYPITPQSEVAEYLSKRLPEVGGVFLQGESEVAVSYMIFGAAAWGSLHHPQPASA